MKNNYSVTHCTNAVTTNVTLLTFGALNFFFVSLNATKQRNKEQAESVMSAVAWTHYCL